MDVKEKVIQIIDLLEKEHPDAKIALRYSNPLELLVATMLSAQCTDERVNEVTKSLFKKYRTAEDYAKADLETLENDIRQTGFYKNKARNLKNACQMLVEKFGSEVPRTMNELLMLPGIARKTANIVLSNAYGIIEGIAVDTHVRRLAERLGLTKSKVQDKIEKDLMELSQGRSGRGSPTYSSFMGGESALQRNQDAANASSLIFALQPQHFKGLPKEYQKKKNLKIEKNGDIYAEI